MKRVFALMVAAALLVSCSTPDDDSDSSKDDARDETKQGTVLTIYCWNDEFPTRFKDYFEKPGLLPEGVTVNWVITSTDDNAYQTKLDAALTAQGTAKDDDKIDIFLIESDYAVKYTNTDYTLDIINDVGLSTDDLSKMYQYTKDCMTNSKGVLKGVSWQACPGGLIYNRTIAKALFGSDDPATVQGKLDTWAEFEAVAVDAKAKGYHMLSGYDADYRVFYNSMTAPWVDASGKINIDASFTQWVQQTKTFSDAGYNNKIDIWSDEAKLDTANGKVFSYFGPPWFFDFCLSVWAKADPKGANAVGNGTWGDWALCKGPQSFSWGGTWLCAAAGTDNLELVKSVMKTLTADKATLLKMTKEKGDFTNNEDAMAEIATSDFKDMFLGGQNYVSILLDSAKSFKRGNITAYDIDINNAVLPAYKDYFAGTITKEQALEKLYTDILAKYPNLTK